MRQNTGKDAIESICDDDCGQFGLREFGDEFFGADAAVRRAMLADELLRGDRQTDAVADALAAYRAKWHAIGGVPDWALGGALTLAKPIFYGQSNAHTMRGYRAVSTPLELMRHHTFSEPRPFRRACDE